MIVDFNGLETTQVLVLAFVMLGEIVVVVDVVVVVDDVVVVVVVDDDVVVVVVSVSSYGI